MRNCPRCGRMLVMATHAAYISHCPCGWSGQYYDVPKEEGKIMEGIDTYLKHGEAKCLKSSGKI